MTPHHHGEVLTPQREFAHGQKLQEALKALLPFPE